MPILEGRELSPDDLAAIRKQVQSFDIIEAVSDEMRELIEAEWPHLAWKLPPRAGERAQ